MRKLGLFLYFLLVIIIAILALSIGSSNTMPIEFNLLFVKVQTNLSIVVASSILFGAFFQFLLMFYYVCKQKCIIYKLKRTIKNHEEKLSQFQELAKSASLTITNDNKTQNKIENKSVTKIENKTENKSN